MLMEKKEKTVQEQIEQEQKGVDVLNEIYDNARNERRALTVGDMKKILEHYDDNIEIYKDNEDNWIYPTTPSDNRSKVKKLVMKTHRYGFSTSLIIM